MSAIHRAGPHHLGARYRNPVVSNGADPGTIRVGDHYVDVTTGGGPGGDFTIRTSPDLVHWTEVGHILNAANLANTWIKPDGQFWAPEIHRVHGRFAAYFAAQDKSGGFCIGCATAPSPTGPFKVTSRPLAEAPRAGGAIDPTYFRDSNGRRYLLYKVNGNGAQPRQPARIMIARLSRDGTRVVSRPRQILRNTQPWERGVVEAPEMVKHGKHYFLFYSGGIFSNRTYAEGVARSTSVFGPFTKHPGPILHSGRTWLGPGHGEPVSDPRGRDWFVYAAHPGSSGARELLLDRIHWVNTRNGLWPIVNDGMPSSHWRRGP